MMKKETSYKAIRATKNTKGIERVKGREKVQENEGKGVNKGCVVLSTDSVNYPPTQSDGLGFKPDAPIL